MAAQFTDILGRRDLADQCSFVGEYELMDLIHDPDLPPKEIVSSWPNPVLCFCTNPVSLMPVRCMAQRIWGEGNYLLLDWDAAAESAPDLTYWPYFFLEQRRSVRRVMTPRRYRVSMLSGQAREHRLALWSAVRDLISQQDIVVINSFGLANLDLDIRDLPRVPWSNHSHGIDHDQDRDTVNDTTSIAHPAYRACVNITAETRITPAEIFVTEKTWKALQAGCLCWHWPGSGHAKYLAQLGFHTWFDQQDLINSARQLFARDDLWQLYHDNLDFVQEDIDLFWSDHLVHRVTQPAITALESWLDR
jgi:hypothetical protein